MYYMSINFSGECSSCIPLTAWTGTYTNTDTWTHAENHRNNDHPTGLTPLLACRERQIINQIKNLKKQQVLAAADELNDAVDLAHYMVHKTGCSGVRPQSPIDRWTWQHLRKSTGCGYVQSLGQFVTVKYPHFRDTQISAMPTLSSICLAVFIQYCMAWIQRTHRYTWP